MTTYAAGGYVVCPQGGQISNYRLEPGEHLIARREIDGEMHLVCIRRDADHHCDGQQ